MTTILSFKLVGVGVLLILFVYHVVQAIRKKREGYKNRQYAAIFLLGIFFFNYFVSKMDLLFYSSKITNDQVILLASANNTSMMLNKDKSWRLETQPAVFGNYHQSEDTIYLTVAQESPLLPGQLNEDYFLISDTTLIKLEMSNLGYYLISLNRLDQLNAPYEENYRIGYDFSISF